MPQPQSSTKSRPVQNSTHFLNGANGGHRIVAAPRFRCKYPEDFKPQPRSWLVQKIVPEKALGILYAPSGCGKSTFLTALACQLAAGGVFLGRKCKPRGTIYVACEDPDGIDYRREAYIRHSDLKRESLSFGLISEAPDLWSETTEHDAADIDLLIEAIREELFVQRERGAECGLVVLDTSRKASPGMEENSSKDTDRMCRIARRIIAECQVAVILVSHVAQNGGEDPRGSTAYLGDADFALGLRKHADEGLREVWVRKMRNGADAEGDPKLRWAYRLRSISLGFAAEDGEDETQTVFEELNVPPPAPSRKGKPRKTPGGAAVVKRALTQLLSEGMGERPPSNTQCPADRLALPVAVVLERARSLGISKASCKDRMEASRKAFERGKEHWLDSGEMHERDEWIWLSRP